MDVAKRIKHRLPNLPKGFKPKPYAWHAAAFTALVSAQVASDHEVFPRDLKTGKIEPFQHFGNIPTSFFLALSGVYASLWSAKKANLQIYDEANIPLFTTRAACMAVGGSIGLLANSAVETRTGLRLLGMVTDLYSNEGGINGGSGGDLIVGSYTAALAGVIAPSTFRTLHR